MNDPMTRPPVSMRPMPFSMILDEAMRRVRRHFRAIYPAVAIPLVILATLTSVLQALSFRRLTSETGSTYPLGFSFGTMFVGLLMAAILGIGFIALQKAAVDAVAGRPIDMKAAWRFAVRPAVLGTLVLQGLAIMASAMLCFFPFLFVAPLLSLTAPIMADEYLFGSTALSRSAELTRYNPQSRFSETPLVKALALIVVGVLISYAVGMLVALPFQIPMMIGIFKQAAAGKEPNMGEMAKWLWLQAPAAALQTLANVAIYLYSSFGFALLFFDARNRKEGSDLAAEIKTVFGPGSPAGGPQS
jgi:hypothetical protein